MMKWIGAVLVLCGAGGFGIGKTVQLYRQMRQLRELSHALEILKCEMNYSLAEVPKLCRTTAKRVSGSAGAFLERYAAELESGQSRSIASRRAMTTLCVTSDAQLALLELFESLGRYELPGENRLLQMTMHRLRTALERCEKEKKPLAKSYAALALCAGIALVILMV